MCCGEGKVVCVTGASGYIASWIVKLLLHRRYTVNATVRDPYDLKKTAHLLALEGAKERLHLFEADLLDEGSFDSAVDGCVGVFHTASPVSFSVVDPQAEVLNPAVNGTLNVLKSCAKVPSLKRVVITSSLATVMFHGKTLTPDSMVDETWYSDTAVCEELKLWYMLAKTLAEQAAWKFTKENGIDLVPSANGRYCLTGRAAHHSEVLKMLRGLYPSLFLDKKYEDDEPAEPADRVSDEKVKGLGVDLMSLEATIVDTIESLKEKNLLDL